jgi:RNA polymerase sigma factor (sigma-70 family)
MKKRKPNLQKIKVIETADVFQGERSPYNEWARNNDAGDGDRFAEHPEANPDVLPATEIASPSMPQLLMGEAIEHLQGRQREVYLLVMRESKSLAEVAEILGISKSAVQKFKERAIKFVQQYCHAAMAKGRV